jgi:epoxyqueuosine reductase
MSADRKESLRREAEALGFHLFGVAPARPAATGEFFARWLGDGYHAEMGYMARRVEERMDVGKILPGARSIICVGVSYNGKMPDASGLRGRIARYARGEDYHAWMGKKLERLAARIPGKARWYVDTGPVLEREYAVRAGLGWFGKNTNLIRQGTGSYLLLGEIITDLLLPPDAPVPDRCGTCTACIDACPTDAIREPYRVDSNACIAYLTIEHRGAIPEEHREGMGDWVFGCDICQEVCPWNGKAPEVRDPWEGGRPDLISLLEMTEDQFRERFRGTAVRRTGWRGMRRNAAVALGNSADPTAAPPLERALDDPDPMVREHAARALGQLERRS